MATQKDKVEKKETMSVQEAGHMGGQRVRELIREGKEAEQQSGHGRRGQHKPDNNDNH